MAVQPGLCLTCLETPVYRFSRDEAHIAGDARYLFLRSIIPDLFALMLLCMTQSAEEIRCVFDDI